MGMPQEEKRSRIELTGELNHLWNHPSGGGLRAQPGFLILVPYFPVEFNIPQSDTQAVAGVLFLLVAWMLCRRR